jgi:murein L,D-transpeptidase YcbB/YkuD
MPGVRFDRFLVSTAVVLLLSGGAGGALAEPKFGTDLDAAPGAAAAPLPSSETHQHSAKPARSPDGPAAKPQASIETPAAVAAKTPESRDRPTPALSAAIAKSAESTDRMTTATLAPPPAASPAPQAQQATAEPRITLAPAATPSTPSANSDPQPPTAEPTITLAPAVAAPAPSSTTDQQQPSAEPAITLAPAVATPALTSTPSSEQPAATPAAPTVTEAPAAPPQPAASTGGDEVPAPAVGAPPAATPSVVVDANAAVTDQLRELANGKFDRILGGKKERTTIEAFYSGRNYGPLWITDGKANARAKAAIAYLGQVDTDGLDPADYPVPNFASLTDPAALAEAEIRLTTAVITYAHHAQVGRVHWTRVSGDIYYDQKPPNPAEVLANMAAAADVGVALDGYEPQHPAYVALKAKLAEIRAGKEDARKAAIPNGPVLKVGMQDERVPQLRDRLRVRGGDAIYDKDLAAAVKKFQQEHELKPTGTLTPTTVEALNGRQPDRPVDTIIANLERWRWMPHDLGRTYVMVNLPDFTLRVMHDGKELWKTKIVDGKPNMPTPIMTAEMKYITVNPTWNVPPSIVAREYMPVLQQDPTALERIGLTVSTNPDGTVHISQPPGERNALGRLRFNFPNKFLVYQHDTPEKQLFAYDKRAFSHGCMRVQDPVRYAEVLLSIVRPHDGYTQDRIRKLFGNSELDIQFPTVVPVHLTYQTAFVDDGKLEFRDDVYGRDKALLAILKGDERRVADLAIERKESPVRRELLAMPEQTWGGRNFFSRVFGGPAVVQPAPAPAPRKRSAQRPTEIR